MSDGFFEDRFMSLQQVAELSVALSTAGLRHVVSSTVLDPKWRQSARPDRPELEPTAWTVKLGDSVVPMPKLKELIAICESLGMTFWMGGNAFEERDGGYGCEFYVRIKRGGSPDPYP